MNRNKLEGKSKSTLATERELRRLAERQAAELYERERYLTMLNDITRAALETPDLQTMLQTLADRLGELIGADGCYITLWDEAQQMPYPAAAYGPMREKYSTVRVEPGEATMTESVLRLGRPLAVEDVFDTPYLSPRIAALFPARSQLALPLVAGAQKLGAALIAFNETHHFTPDEIARCEQAAGQIALALAKARLFEETQRRLQELTLLFDCSTALSTSLDIDTVLLTIAQQITTILSVEGCAISEWDRKRDVLVTLLDYAIDPGWWEAEAPGTIYHLAEYPCARRVLNDRVRLSFRVSDPEVHPVAAAWMRDEEVKTLLMVPLVTRDQVIGLLEVMEARKERMFTPTEVSLCQTLANLAASALENARLFQAEREQRKLAEALRKATAAVSSTLDLDKVLDRILEQVNRVVPSDAANIMLITDDQAHIVRWRGYEQWGAEEVVRSLALCVADTANLQRMRESGDPIVIPDIRDDDDWVYVPGAVWSRSYLGVPIRVRDRVIGFLNLESAAPGFFYAAHADRLRAFADQAGLVIENAQLYEQARRDAETQAVLLHEVNHRVKNNLAAIVGLLYTEQRRASKEDQAVYRSITQDLINRVQGLATAHNLLSASAWAPLLLSELASQVIHSSLQMVPHNKRVRVDVAPSPVRVTANQAHNLALVINELATNTVKHALQERDGATITVRVARQNNTVQFEFRDDGPGYPDEILQWEGDDPALDLVQSIVRQALGGALSLSNDHGAVTTIRFAAQVE